MSIRQIKQKYEKAQELEIKHVPHSNYTILSGVTQDGAFYEALSRRTFDALKQRGVIIQCASSTDDQEVWFFSMEGVKC